MQLCIFVFFCISGIILSFILCRVFLNVGSFECLCGIICLSLFTTTTITNNNYIFQENIFLWPADIIVIVLFSSVGKNF